MTNTEQQARELLAAEYGEHPQWEGVRKVILAGSCEFRSDPVSLAHTQAIRAIKAALERTHNPDLEGLVERLRACRVRASCGPDWLRKGTTPDLLDEAADAIEALSTIQPPAIEDERGKIVAWLRDGMNRFHGPLQAIANAIERGEHLSSLSSGEGSGDE